jgi:hypothetical protein
MTDVARNGLARQRTGLCPHEANTQAPQARQPVDSICEMFLPWQIEARRRARLFRGCNLFDRRFFDVGLFALFVGLVQELGDDFTALLLLPSFLRLA